MSPIGLLLLIWLGLTVIVSPGFATDDEDAAVPPPPKKKEVSYGGEIDFVSRYVWRGIAFSDGPELQPSAWISVQGFTFTVWNNIDLTDEPNRGPYNELDLYITYRNHFKKLQIEPSLYLYYYPTQQPIPSSGEFSLKLSYPVGPISVFTTQTVDIAKHEGAYYGEFGLGYKRDLAPGFSLETLASFAWANGRFNEAYLHIHHTAVNVFTYDLKLLYYPLKFLFLRPHMEVTTLLDDELRAQVKDPTIVSGGLAVGVEF